MKKVMNNAKPIKIWFGGDCWVPMALLKRENTTIILVKDVISIKMAGAIDKTVITNKMVNVVLS